MRRLLLGLAGGLALWAGIFLLGFDVADWIGQAFVRPLTCPDRPSAGLHDWSVSTPPDRGLHPMHRPFGTLGVALAQEVLNRTLDPAAGARLFETKGCVTCHAVNGVGGQEGPDLGQIERPRSFYDVAARMWNHLPRMSQRIWALRTNRPYLSPDEMSDLMAFLYTPEVFSRPGAVNGGQRSFGEPGDRQRGRQVVANKGCLECHSLSSDEGRHKVAGPLDRWTGFDSPWGVVATMWNHAFLMDVETRRPNGAWPRLTSGEMADLAAFLAHQ